MFIKNIVGELSKLHDISMLSPRGPAPNNVHWVSDEKAIINLEKVADLGGPAHLLRTAPLKAARYIPGLVSSLIRVYRSNSDAEILHINWLQNSIGSKSRKTPKLLTVLGTDYKLLQLPLVKTLVRRQISSSNCVIAPNADWMCPLLKESFGDIADIHPVHFGCSEDLYDITRAPKSGKWIVVQRVTKAKMGPLFLWYNELPENNSIHLFGPNQEGLKIPEGISFHGSTTLEELKNNWLSSATGIITLSTHDEGLPQILIEAAASGLPIIASNQVAHKEIVQHGQNGYIVNSPKDFLNAVNKLNNLDHNIAFSKKSREIAKQKFGTWRDCAQRYNELYKRLL
ncbi:glycosyltransferase family 4 protein [uncultured Pseudoteredinibacter sp.]|uniref:glycosyltransferase family 4 protein n=1 Tax=uncultured Pseudoteredinibacter sp. TaxID=1641701 RepID=UPI00261AFC25|nr:glycosyltransferase family 4 protein [uncultured Pseudoteredinibacter sp.]